LPATVDYRILGPLEVTYDGRRIDAGGPKQRALLAVLLLHANEPISRERLLFALWGDDPPKTAAKAIQVFVSRLRKTLKDDLITSGDGYLLRTEPPSVDLHEFRRRLAARLFGDALALWRGPALADLRDNAYLRDAAERLDELRLTALEERIEADLAAGGAAELVPELEQLAAEHPLRERFRAQLMVALYRAGRQADALDVAREARVALTHAGLEPSPIVRDIERAILRQDPSLLPSSPQDEQPAVSELRRPVVALVAELAEDDEADPEAVAAFAEGWLPAAATVVEQHGGTFHQQLDGSAVAIFGFPTAHEDDAARAVRAAVELRDELAQRGGPVSARIGVAGGEMLVSQRVGATPLAGAPIRRAAQLARRADAGDVNLDDEVQERATTPRTLRLDAPFVGRDAELRDLEQVLAASERERRCMLVSIVGEPGIGKSRFAWELAQRRPDMSALFGRCPPYGEAITLWPLGEIVERAAAGRDAAAIERLLGGEAEASEIAERIAGALGSSDEASNTADTRWAFRRLFETLGRRQPVLAVFEDMQWAEETLVELLCSFANEVQDSPVVFVCTSREPISRLKDMAEAFVVLEPLDDDAGAALYDRLRPVRLPAARKSRLLRAAGGNPLFIEQVLAHGVGAPTLESLLAMRLDGLEPPARELLGRAAVIGTEFREDALLALSPSSAEAIGLVESLVGRGFLASRGKTATGHPLFRFRHGLIRDASYNAATKQVRSELHERLAEWLTRRVAGRRRELDQLLGYHLEQAYRLGAEAGAHRGRLDGLARVAAERLGSAATFALDRSDMPAAINLLRRSSDLLPVGDPQRIELQIELGQALRQVGSHPEAAETLADARARALAGEQRSLEAYAALAEAQLRVQMDDTVTPAELESVGAASSAVFEDTGERRWAARAWFVRALAPWFSSQCGPAQDALERSLALARSVRDRATERDAVSLLIGAIFQGPIPASEGIVRCEQILASRIGDRRLEASAYRALGAFKAMRGEFEEGRALVARDKAILDDLGLKPANGVAAWVRAYVELLAGDPVGAERVLLWGYEVLLDIGDSCRTATLTAHMAEALYQQQRFDEAIEWIARCRAEVGLDDHVPEVDWRAVRARIHARAGETEAAEALAREALSIAEETDFPMLHGVAWHALGDVLAAAAARSQARSAFAKAQAHYERKGDLVSAARAAGSARSVGARKLARTAR
jgi:DNA-binding SARP family transcriptional activator/tetratricopeptide (TPR) repeat protein